MDLNAEPFIIIVNKTYIKMQFKGVLHPEMPDILFFLISRYFYNLIFFKSVHIHS